tara:strand:+ start:1703 stop:3427 length:1725 start_codon:yes stop_codon:yes gene_type:complete
MANFDVQIQALAGTATQTEMDQWMMDGTREIINMLPPHLKEYCYSKQTFTSAAANSEAETMITGQLGSVFAGSVECRQIRPMDKHKASSSTSIEYASATDPVYYLEGNKINILPASSSGIYYVVANPSINASDVSTIDNFPNEAEYLVVLYAACKVLQNKMNEMDTVSAIDTTALGAISTELGETQAVCDKIDADLVLSKAEIVLAKAEAAELATQTDNGGNFETACDAMATELNKVDEIIDLANDEFDEVSTQVSGSKDSPITDAFTQFELVAARLSQGETDTEGDINTALGLVKTAVDQAATAAGKFTSATESIFGDEDTFLTSNSQLTRVKEALDKAQHLMSDDASYNALSGVTDDVTNTSALYWLGDEDTEMVNATLSLVNTEIKRAQLHIQEWTSIGDMVVKEIQAALQEADGYTKEVQARLAQAQAKREEAQARIAAGNAYLGEAKASIEAGNAYIKEAQARIAQAQGYASEVGARAGFSSAKLQAVQGHINTAQTYVATAQGFGAEIQAKVAIAQGYVAEANVRMARETQKYQWYQAQQTKLQQDYDKGVQMLISQGIPQPAQKEAN